MKLRTGSVYTFKPSFWDIADRRENTPDTGAVVRVIKAPYGCPPNGTMGHCYVETIQGEFIGLVACNSLTK